MGYAEEHTARLKIYQINQQPDCVLCIAWFLGCLNGRKKWKDEAVTPNYRYAGQSGKEYPKADVLSIPDEEYPLRGYCDAFKWDTSPERLGRAVY